MVLSTRLTTGGGLDDYDDHHQFSITKPSRLLNSILLSTKTTANNVLASVGSSSAAATRDGGRWKARDHLRCLFMLAMWVTVWGLRLLMDTFSYLSVSSSSPPLRSREAMIDGFLASSSGSSSAAAALVVHEGFGRSDGSSTRAVGRALSHVLTLLNEIPATSRKYEFALSMAESILEENAQDGHVALVEINREALVSAFSRTSDRLLRLLQGSHASDAAAATWPSRALRLLPMGNQLASYYDGLCSIFLSPDLAAAAGPGRQQLVGVAGGTHSECVEAEKFARELLWITSKMRACSGVDDAIVRWSFASGLASLSLTAHQRIQGPIVKITAILLRELAGMEWEVPRDVRFMILALWLPLFCYSGRGIASPVMNVSEKREMERVLEELIQGLPWNDQEVILANWLEDFTSSDSDWPNLQKCYDHWCRSSRKLLL